MTKAILLSYYQDTGIGVLPQGTASFKAGEIFLNKNSSTPFLSSLLGKPTQ